MSRFIPTAREHVLNFTTGNDIIDRHFNVSDCIYYDDEIDGIRYVNIVSEGLYYKVYWDITDNVLVLFDGENKYCVTDFSDEILNTITAWYDPNYSVAYERSSDLCHVHIDLTSPYISIYNVYDKKHEHNVGHDMRYISLFYALEHKMYGTTRFDIEFTILEHHIRNIEVYSVYPDGRQRFGIHTDDLIAIVDGVTYRVTKRDYKDYLESGSLGDVEIIRCVKSCT